MTREEAVKEFKSELKWAELNTYPYVSKQKIDADKMAIKALEQELCEDAISREDLLLWLDDINNSEIGKKHTGIILDIQRHIRKMTPVTPERPKGKWIVDDFTELIKCSNCGDAAYMDTTSGEQCMSNYCPSCGCDNRGEEE